MERMTDNYQSELKRWLDEGRPLPVESFIDLDEKKIKWTRELKNDFSRGTSALFVERHVRPSLYRPFCKQWVYMDRQMNNCVYLQPSFFPQREIKNLSIQLSGIGSSREFSCILSDLIFNSDTIDKGQCFPFYWYENLDNCARLFDATEDKLVNDAQGVRYVRHDAITDRTLEVFRAAYPIAYATRAKKNGGPGLNKEDIFYYVYGILHSLVYREKYAANLAKELPRIPLVRDFEAFADAGRQLAHLHLHYEELEPWPTVSVDMPRTSDPGPVKKIAWAKKKDPETGKRVPDYTKLVYNANLTITGIPEEAQNYVVNGRSPLDWVIDRYQVKTDKKSGITNDPNDYSDDPWYIVDLIVRLVRVSMETQQIVQSLPTNIDEIPHPDNWPVEWTASLKGASDG